MKIELNIRTTHRDKPGNGGMEFTEPGVGAVLPDIPATVPNGLTSEGPIRPDAPMN